MTAYSVWPFAVSASSSCRCTPLSCGRLTSTSRHAAIGLGAVDFSPLPAVLAQIGFSRRPILKFIAAEPDDAIEHSARRLVEMGFPQ